MSTFKANVLDSFESPAGYRIALLGPFGILGYRVMIYDFNSYKHRYTDFPPGPDGEAAARAYCDLWRI